MAADPSSRPLAARLGLDPGHRVLRVDLPPEVAVALGESGPEPAGAPDAIVCAVPDNAAIERVAPRLVAAYRSGGRLWMLYPKRSGRIPTDISRDRGWQPLLAHGFVPVAQVAVDADWSALRFRRQDEVRSLTRKSVIGGGAPGR